MSGSVLTPMQRIIIATAQRQPGQYSRIGLAKLLAGSRSRQLGILIDSPDHGRLGPAIAARKSPIRLMLPCSRGGWGWMPTRP
jgi:hypothetical protein